MTEENATVVETTEDVTTEVEATDWKEKYEQAEANHQKYKGYFKKEKAKQKDSPSAEGVNVDEIESRLYNKLEFYNSNPAAKELKAEIDAYTKEGMAIDKAFKLAAAENNPSLLMDQQTINKSQAQKKELTGAPVNTS